MASNNDRDRLIKTFMARTNTGRRKKRGPLDQGFPRPGQGENARFKFKSSNGGGGQYYVSQGRAVENAANARNYAQGRARTEREQSQQRMRHQLGYDKPGLTAADVKRKAKKAAKKINPFD